MSSNTKCRLPHAYPETAIKRSEVPDDKVSWKVDFPDYKPTEYTAEKVLKKPVWADPDPRLVILHFLNWCPK